MFIVTEYAALNSFLVFLCNKIKTNFDKRNNFNLRMRNRKFQ